MRLALISDIHEDVENLDIALGKIQTLNCDFVSCLGDIVGFNIPWCTYLAIRNSSKCVLKVSKECGAIVVGNHDLFAIRKIPICADRFTFPVNWYSQDYQTRLRLSDGKVWLYEENELSALLSLEEKKIINSFQESAVIDVGPNRVLLSHYLYPNFTGSEIVTTNFQDLLTQHLNYMFLNNLKMSFVGHGHPEFCKIYVDGIWSSLKYGESWEVPSKFGQIVCVTPPLLRRRVTSGFVVFDSDLSVISAHKI